MTVFNWHINEQMSGFILNSASLDTRWLTDTLLSVEEGRVISRQPWLRLIFDTSKSQKIDGDLMEADNQRLGEYLALIKKITGWRIKNPNHYNIKEDVVHEAFLKLFNAGFFDKHEFHSEEEQKMISAYVGKTVHSCYMDQLISLGYIRRRTKDEMEGEGGKYKTITNDQLEGVIETDEALPISGTPDQYVLVKEAYQQIKRCFEFLTAKIRDTHRKSFFYAAFWQFDAYCLPLIELAKKLDYNSSNPTQELNRFVKKVSLCTEPHGIKVTDLHEQIQFLQEHIVNSEAVS